MSILSGLDSKTIDELRELGKLAGNEKTIISDGVETRKVSIDTIVGYAARRLSVDKTGGGSLPSYGGGGDLVFVPEGQSVPINERTPGTFYIEETRQTSIRTRVSIPTSVVVSSNFGLKRI